MTGVSPNISRRTMLGGLAASGVITLTACGSSSGSGSGSGKPLVMTVWGGDTDKATYQARLDALKATHPDINVKLQLIPATEYPQKVQTMIAGGTGPDILELAETINVFSSKSQILPLDSYISEAKLDLAQLYGKAIPKYFNYDGKQYAMPDRSGAMITYWNKTAFDKKGMKTPTDWTWQDLIDGGKELSGGGKFGHAGFNWWPLWMSLVYQNGGTVIDSSGKATLNSPECVEAMQFVSDLTFKHKVIPTPRDYQNWSPDAGGDAMFAAGNVYMSATGFWNIGTLAKAGKINFDLASFVKGKNPAVCASFSGLAISRSCKQPKQAFAAIQFLTGAEAQKKIISMGEDVPADVAVQNSDSFLNPKWLKKDIDMKVFPDSVDQIFVPPLIPQWNEMSKALDDTLNGFWNGKQTAQAALNAAQQRVTSVLSRG